MDFIHPLFPLAGSFHSGEAVYSPEWEEMKKAGYKVKRDRVCTDLHQDGDEGYADEFSILAPDGKEYDRFVKAASEFFGEEIIGRWNRRIEAMQSQKLSAEQIWAIQ